MEAGRQILEIGERVAVRGGGQIEGAVITAGPTRTIRLGHKMKGEDQGLLEQGIIPATSSLANLSLACWRRRGSRRQALQKQEGQWCGYDVGHHGEGKGF